MAQKKISELVPLTTVSGSAIMPIVAGDTTYQVTVQQLKLYTDQGLALSSSISGSFTSLSSSITNRLVVVENSISSDNSLLNIFSSSVNTTTSSLIGITNGLMAYTASLNQQTSSQNSVNLGISIVTGSLNTYTSSNESWKDGVRGEVNGLEAYTASLKGAIEVSGQNVNVLGMITAQQFNVTYVSSSTLYQSGSTKFGDTSDDRHEFTGSVNVSGSLVVQNGVSGSFSGSFTGNGAGLTQVPSASIASDLYKPTGTISVGIGGDSNIIQISGSLIQLGNPTLYTETLVSRQLAVSGGIMVHNTLGNGFATIGVDNAGSAQIGANNNLNILLKNDGRSILYNGVEVSASISVQNNVEAVNLIGSLLSTNGVVSSSTQITNYYKFAETASANTFYGNQTLSGSLNVTGSVNIDNVIKLTPVTPFPNGQAGMLVASASYGFTNLYIYDGSEWKWLVTGSIQS